MTHGMAAWGGLWIETAEALAAKGYHVIAVDQSPFGFSDREYNDYSRPAQAARLKETIDGLGLGKVYLVGHSYGGGVTLEMALRHPDRVAGMVLVCPVTGLLEAGKRHIPDAGPRLPPLPLRYPPAADFLVASTITNPLMTRFLMGRFMEKKHSMTDAHVEILQRPMRRSGNTRAMTLWLQQFLAGDPGAMSANRASVAGLKVRSELIWGEMDAVTPIAQGEDLADLIGFGSFERLPGIGHMPQIEDPALFNAALITALDRVSEKSFTKWRVRQTAAAF